MTFSDRARAFLRNLRNLRETRNLRENPFPWGKDNNFARYRQAARGRRVPISGESVNGWSKNVTMRLDFYVPQIFYLSQISQMAQILSKAGSHPHKQSQLCCVKFYRSPEGQRLASDTKTLVEL